MTFRGAFLCKSVLHEKQGAEQNTLSSHPHLSFSLGAAQPTFVWTAATTAASIDLSLRRLQEGYRISSFELRMDDEQIVALGFAGDSQSRLVNADMNKYSCEYSQEELALLNENNLRQDDNGAGWAIHSSNSCNLCLDLENLCAIPASDSN